jgi:hypothetical protein
VNYLPPGILLITIASGISYTALRLFTDMNNGIFERFQSLPIARSAVPWAHVLTSVATTAASPLIVIAVAVAAGFRTSAGPVARLAIAGIAAVNTTRALPERQPASASIWTGLAWCAGILLASHALAMLACRRKIA